MVFFILHSNRCSHGLQTTVNLIVQCILVRHSQILNFFNLVFFRGVLSKSPSPFLPFSKVIFVSHVSSASVPLQHQKP